MAAPSISAASSRFFTATSVFFGALHVNAFVLRNGRVYDGGVVVE
jgi:hypothetical protein